jgi:predicted amidohydrolase YtcJ
LEDQHLVRAFGLPAREAFRFRSLLATGLPLAFGSDAPVAPPQYALNLEAATRHPLFPGESLSPEEVLQAHTLGAAQAAGWEDYGWLQAGVRADLTLWEGGRPVGRVYRGNLELF